MKFKKRTRSKAKESIFVLGKDYFWSKVFVVENCDALVSLGGGGGLHESKAIYNT